MRLYSLAYLWLSHATAWCCTWDTQNLRQQEAQEKSEVYACYRQKSNSHQSECLQFQSAMDEQPDLAMQSKGTWGTEFTGCPCKTPTASTLLTALMLPMHMYQSLQGWTSCLLQRGSCLAAGKSTVGGSPKKHFTWEWEDKARRKLASVYLDTRMPSTWRLGRSAQGCLWRSFSYSHSNPVGQHLPMVSW